MTEFYYYGARYYDARLSRFLSVDPLADIDLNIGWNPYHYVHNNSIRLTDPTGMKADTLVPDDRDTQFLEQYQDDIARLKSDPYMAPMIEYLEKHEMVIPITEASNIAGTIKNFISDGWGDQDHVEKSITKNTNTIDPVTVKYSQINLSLIHI